MDDLLAKMPDHRLVDATRKIRDASSIQPPGIVPVSPPAHRKPGPIRICWAARWEHDKAPEVFFDALGRLAEQGVDFRLNVLGEQFRHIPPIFARARDQFAPHIDHWGYQASRPEYLAALAESDVIVSTARHEFFGISVLEAAAAGCVPVLPKRLAYPEIFSRAEEEFFYDGSCNQLANRLAELAASPKQIVPLSCLATQIANRYFWPQRAAEMNQTMETLAHKAPSRA